jgi:hypothetical protein
MILFRANGQLLDSSSQLQGRIHSHCSGEAGTAVTTPAKKRAEWLGQRRSRKPSNDQNSRNSQTMSQYHKLYHPEDSAVVFIDHSK